MAPSERPVPQHEWVRRRMSQQKRQGTAPEMLLRRLLFAQRLRYRVGMKVPGLPRRTIDIAFTRQKVAVFVDGCFWHGCPQHCVPPKNNADWWSAKLAANKARDLETTAHLEGQGWRVVRIWEHETPVMAAQTVTRTLTSPEARGVASNLAPQELESY